MHNWAIVNRFTAQKCNFYKIISFCVFDWE